MTDPATTISAARLGWQLLAKVPWLARWLLHHVFPVNKCKDRFLVDVPGTHARFELLSIRPSPVLTGLEVRVYNPLPFAVEFSTFNLKCSIDSIVLLDAVLNSKDRSPPPVTRVYRCPKSVSTTIRQNGCEDYRGNVQGFG